MEYLTREQFKKKLNSFNLKIESQLKCECDNRIYYIYIYLNVYAAIIKVLNGINVSFVKNVRMGA